VSEQYIYVSCRCFRDGLTSEVPVPRPKLRLDGFGNLAPAKGGNAEDFSEELFDWMRDRACAHGCMRLVETIFHPYIEYPPVSLRDRRDIRNPRLVRELDSGRYPDLTRVLDEFPHAHGVVVWPDQAPDILGDLDRLAAHRLPGDTRTLVDERGTRLWPTIDQSGYDGNDTFTSVYDNPRPESDRVDLLEIGVSDHDVVVRSSTTGRELLRDKTIEQIVDRSDVARVGYRLFPGIQFRELASGTEANGYGDGVGHGSFANFHQPVHAYAQTLRVSQIPLVLADTAYFPRPLRAALEACIATGNPIVTYHSGSSLGFERADQASRVE